MARETRPVQPQDAANSAPSLERHGSPVQFRAKPVPSFIKKASHKLQRTPHMLHSIVWLEEGVSITWWRKS